MDNASGEISWNPAQVIIRSSGAFGTLVALLWHSGGTLVALWWHSGGTLMALWWHSDGTLVAL